MVKGAPYTYKYLPKIAQDSDNITIATLYAIIKKSFPDIEVEFYDETIENINVEAINADLVGISAITPTYNRAKEYSCFYRRSSCNASS